MTNLNKHGGIETHGWTIKTPLSPFLKLWQWLTEKKEPKYKWICEWCGTVRPPKADWEVCPVCGGPVIPIEVN